MLFSDMINMFLRTRDTCTSGWVSYNWYEIQVLQFSTLNKWDVCCCWNFCAPVPYVIQFWNKSPINVHFGFRNSRIWRKYIHITFYACFQAPSTLLTIRLSTRITLGLWKFIMKILANRVNHKRRERRTTSFPPRTHILFPPSPEWSD